jgi:hypothetical protein
LTRVGNKPSAEVKSNLILEEQKNYDRALSTSSNEGKKTTLLMNILKPSEVVSGSTVLENIEKGK